ncbi:MAG: alpha/beta fold hydrolase [Gammaproteobacteria bacterium]|nr:alpha/beta fold hydrolase [Gammaproteobacteria bacterium]
MSEPLPSIPPPPLPLLLGELRALAEAPWFTLRTLSLAGLPRGDGHPVLVIPGFLAGDAETWPLRRALSRLGYTVHGWGCGRNLGMRPEMKQKLANRLTRLAGRNGRVSLIGWSLGGVFARELARKAPQQVRRVFTLGSPINGNPAANNLHTLFALINRQRPPREEPQAFRRRAAPPPVPCVAIYSRSDGIVAWRCCREDAAAHTENVEISGSHFGLVVNTQALHALAVRLPRA